MIINPTILAAGRGSLLQRENAGNENINRLFRKSIPQPINLDLSAISSAFFKLCRNDFANLDTMDDLVLVQDLISCRIFYTYEVFDLKLPSIGFIVSLLSFVAESGYAKKLYNIQDGQPMPSIDSINKFLYYPMSFREALLVLKEFQNQIPMVFLDEFIVIDERVYAFIQNIFRALGVVCITMGTDSAASN